jgi:hypothetical protein
MPPNENTRFGKDRGTVLRLPLILLFFVLVLIALSTPEIRSSGGSTSGTTGSGISGAFAPPHSLSAPYYFAGTNCKASGEIIPPQIQNIPGVEHIVTASLKLNGITVRSYEFDPSEPTPMRVSLGITFDSSYFAPGSTVTVEISGYDNLGSYYQDDYQVSVINKVLALNEPSLTTAAYPACDAATGFTTGSPFLQLSNYALHIENMMHWTDDWQFIEQGSANVLVVGAHANSTLHHTGFEDLEPTSEAAFVTPIEAELAQQSNLGTGVPPFNSSATPPLQFVYIVGCNAGDNDEFMRYLWPFHQYGGGWLDDQVTAAFNRLIISGCLYMFANTYKNSLVVGHNAFMSRLIMEQFAVNNPGTLIVRDIDSSEYDRDFSASDLSLFGDPYARIKGAYRQDHVQSLDWSR